MNPTLVIRTEDGANIGIEGRRCAHRASRAGQLWRVAGALLFSADEESYAWLHGALGCGSASSTQRSKRPAAASSSSHSHNRAASD
jgi:hypothetical protein